MNLLMYFVIYGHSWCFESSQIALAYGSCNFENFQNITRAHKSRNALAFIRFPILIAYIALFYNDFRACEKTSKIRIIFNVCLISPISCWHVTRPSLHSVRLMNEWWSAHHSLFFRHKKFWCIMVYLRTLKWGAWFYLIRI